MSAIAHSRDAILAAPHQDRNNTLYRKARWCFEIAAGGDLRFEDVREQLHQAGREAGLDKAEIKATLRSAEREGRRKPISSKNGSHPSEAETLPVLPPEQPVYPPHHVWTAIWEAAEGVFTHDEPLRWLGGRGIDLERLSGARLCKYLPKGASLPKELHPELREAIPKIQIDGQWKHSTLHGFRLLFRLYDSLGDPRSLGLRCIVDHGEKLKAKSVSLKPQKRGLVLANSAGVAMLRRDPMRKQVWGDRLREVVITEGEPDLLAAACEDIGDDRIRAVFGITGSGAWTDAHAIAIPKDAHTIIATDDDIAGNRYADKIAATLEGRRVSRWEPLIKGQDVCDAGGLAGGMLQ